MHQNRQKRFFEFCKSCQNRVGRGKQTVNTNKAPKNYKKLLKLANHVEFFSPNASIINLLTATPIEGQRLSTRYR